MTGNIHYWRSYISDCLDREFNREQDCAVYTALLQRQQEANKALYEARSQFVRLCCYVALILEVYSMLSDDFSLGCLENENTKEILINCKNNITGKPITQAHIPCWLILLLFNDSVSTT
jgi:hypothetical protein